MLSILGLGKKTHKEMPFEYFEPGTTKIYEGWLCKVIADYGADAYVEFEEGPYGKKMIYKSVLYDPLWCHVGEHWSGPPLKNDYMCARCREGFDDDG